MDIVGTMDVIGTWDLFPIRFKTGKTIAKKLIKAIKKKYRFVVEKFKKNSSIYIGV